MKQIFKYILISTAIMLSISACQQEMEAPREDGSTVLSGRIASVEDQVAAVKSTASEISSYYDALNGDFLPDFKEMVNDLNTSADSKGDVTAAIKSIMSDLNEAEESLKNSIGKLDSYIKSHPESLLEMTESTLNLHSEISTAIAELPACVDAVFDFIQMICAADLNDDNTAVKAMADKFSALQNTKFASLSETMDNWVGKNILSEKCSMSRLEKHIILLQGEMENRDIVYKKALQEVVTALENPIEGLMSDDELKNLILTAAKTGRGSLDSDTKSQIENHNSSSQERHDAAESKMRLFSKAVIEAVEYLAPIQSVSYMSLYEEDLAYARYNGYGREDIVIDFSIHPSEIAAILANDWETYVSILAYNPSESMEAGSPATGLSQAPEIKSVSLTGDVMSVTLDAENVPDGVYNGTAPYSIALNVSNGIKELATDFIRLKRKSVPGLQINPYENIPVIKGETKSIPFEYTADGDVTVTVEGNEFIGAASLASIYKDFKTGYISVTISEANSIALQSATVTLTSGSESTTRILTFTEAGSFNINVPKIIPAGGGEITLSISGNITGNTQTEIISGNSWLSKVNGVANTFAAVANTGGSPRTATVKYTINGHSKNATITQFGQNTAVSSYDMFLGTWTMTAKEAISGIAENTRTINISKDLGTDGGYLVTGLSNGSGSYPVKMKYDNVNGDIKFTVPQDGLDGNSLGIYKATLDGANLAGSKDSKTFTFTWDGSQLSGDMTSSESFMYMDNSLNVSDADKTFYYDVILKRAETVILNDGSNCQLENATSTDIEYPLNIIILGDGYLAKDLEENGKFQRAAESAADVIFSYEPYKTFKDRFNVYMIPYASAEEGTSIVNGTSKNTRYSSKCYDNGNTLLTANYETVFNDIYNAGFDDDQIYKSLVILLVNSETSSGTCWQQTESVTTDASKSGDGFLSKHVAMIAANNMMTNGLIIHEAGGHGFGRLADEYTSDSGNTFTSENATSLENTWQQYGFYWNVTPYKNDSKSRWEVFATRPEYQNAGVGYFESAYNYQYGIYRSEESSIMLNNNGRFNVISRFVIFRRIMMTTQPSVYTNDNIHSAFIEYDKKNIAVESISLNTTSEKLDKGGTLQLNATLNIKGGSSVTNKSVVWSSSDENVAKVSSTGLVTAVGSGSATITVQTDDNVYDDRKTNTCSITVSSPVTGVTVTPASYTFTELNTTTELKLNVTGEYTNISWSSSNTSVVTSTVNIYDKTETTITAKGNGSATITATVTSSDGSTHTATCSVNVSSERTTPAVGDYVYSDGSWSDGTEAVESGKTVIGLVCYLGNDIASEDVLLKRDFSSISDSFNAIVVSLSDKTGVSAYKNGTTSDFFTGNNTLNGYNTFPQYNHSSSAPSTLDFLGYTLFAPFYHTKSSGWGAPVIFDSWSDLYTISSVVSGKSSCWYPAGMAECAKIDAMQTSGAANGRTSYEQCSGYMATLSVNTSSEGTKGNLWSFDFDNHAAAGVLYCFAPNSNNLEMRKVLAIYLEDKQ